jgi:hypothetical protein
MAEINQPWRSSRLAPERRQDARRSLVRDLVVEHVDAENMRDMERVMATYADSCVFEDVPARTLFRGKAEIAAAAVALGALPDLDHPLGRLWLALANPFVIVKRVRARLMSRAQ